MINRFFFLVICLFVGCSSPNNKSKYLQDFSIFIEELEIRSGSKNSIDWSIEQDSLDFYLKEKAKYHLSRDDENKLEELTVRF
ncbi:hypothetical protein BWZ22_16295 [Seonamhaeicola sp. S2-3]|uniref:hypothetical protein n=1 Tax=Seonamhaeicola sp. S2-3 TaxID=1936081 RepID=UPI000972C72D|nr:hypothetical protein [Seonamhaeicola sp. S2-3]APY12685.1 hypothetical protein BWZ22_16295 [Seonamhaeicola sp. S2-3]